MHGKTSLIHHDGRGIYRGLSNPFEATRYHSLVIEPGTLPDDLEVVAQTDQNEIMGVRHKRFPLEGVQFHPESFLTEEGIKLLKNFLDQEVRVNDSGVPSDPMLTVAEALAAVLEHARALPSAALPLVEALDCVLAEDAVADLDSPPFDKALVDGYAVRSSDLAGHDRWLAVGETIMAGQVPTRPLGRGEAAVVMTGAPVPPECDAVVMHERTQAGDDRVLILEPLVKAGQNLMARGREMRAGEVVVACGTILRPARLGVLASVGKVDVRVVPRPLVAIVPTGDELVEPGQTPGPGQIRNSNAVLLHALAIRCRARATVLPIAPDDPGPLAAMLERGLEFGRFGHHRGRLGRPARSRPGGIGRTRGQVCFPQGESQAGQTPLVRSRTAAG